VDLSDKYFATQIAEKISALRAENAQNMETLRNLCKVGQFEKVQARLDKLEAHADYLGKAMKKICTKFDERAALDLNIANKLQENQAQNAQILSALQSLPNAENFSQRWAAQEALNRNFASSINAFGEHASAMGANLSGLAGQESLLAAATEQKFQQNEFLQREMAQKIQEVSTGLQSIQVAQSTTTQSGGPLPQQPFFDAEALKVISKIVNAMGKATTTATPPPINVQVVIPPHATSTGKSGAPHSSTTTTSTPSSTCPPLQVCQLLGHNFGGCYQKMKRVDFLGIA
jgi:hypothetical protein